MPFGMEYSAARISHPGDPVYIMEETCKAGTLVLSRRSQLHSSYC